MGTEEDVRPHLAVCIHCNMLKKVQFSAISLQQQRETNSVIISFDIGENKLDDIESLLGNRISEARIAMGFSEKQLAQRLGLKGQTIERWESGEKTPRANKLHQLAGVLGVPVVWLLGGADTPPTVDTPVFDETGDIEDKLAKAEVLINELGFLLTDIRASTRRVQRDVDAG